VTSTLAILDEPVKPSDQDPHDFESIGSILRRMRAGYESLMTPDDFHPVLSLLLDDLVQWEEALSQDEEGQR
jgi:hypothetical protein